MSKNQPPRRSSFQALAFLLSLGIQLGLVMPAEGDRELPQPEPSQPRPVRSSDESLLQTSKNPGDLLEAAQAYAHSQEKAHHRLLEAHLSNPGFLSRLDSARDYSGIYARLRLYHVLTTLGRNGKASAQTVLTNLTKREAYQNNTLRAQALIHALAAITPASREAITFWSRFSGPKNPLAADVAAALCRNQSRPALALFASMLTDRAQPRERKLGWMRQLIPGHRTDAGLLKFCETLLQSGKLEPELQVALVEAIFDYRPELWDPGDGAPAAATWSSASRQARKILKNIATHALTKLSLNARQKQAVRDGLKSLP